MQDNPIPVKDQHLTRRKLRRFLEKHHSLQEENEILLHLISVCPGCRSAGGPLLELFENGLLHSEFSSLDVDLELSRAEAPALWEKLKGFSFEKQKGLMRDVKRFRSWGLCEFLCDESERLAACDAAKAVQAAELAVLGSGRLKEHEPAEKLWLYQLRAYSWAHLGNARRVLGELRIAEDAFAKSDEWWEAAASMGNVLGYEARLLDLKASLRRDQRRLPLALDLLNRALQISQEREDEQTGRLLIKKAKTFEEMGDLDRAITLLREAEPLIAGGEPRLELCLRHNYLWLLTTAGRHIEAGQMLPGVARLSESLGNALDTVRLTWARGRIAAGLGNRTEALRLLEEVRGEFSQRNISYDTALVALELAALHARDGRMEEVKVLAWEMLPIFQAQDVPREAVAALAFFVQAAERETFTVELADRMVAFLRQARHTPDLWFSEAQRGDTGGEDEEGSAGVAR
ncbi:MAG TPA: tetratricopeptide repeat protein [Thermoanaerobaculia bacterium]|nr:tetratricopeptide repeat protein [Thermoanaerobaculia bacterium]